MICHGCKQVITGDYEEEQFIVAVWYWCSECWEDA